MYYPGIEKDKCLTLYTLKIIEIIYVADKRVKNTFGIIFFLSLKKKMTARVVKTDITAAPPPKIKKIKPKNIRNSSVIPPPSLSPMHEIKIPVTVISA